MRAMTAKTNKRKCIYCGGEVRKVKKGEHIIPEAMGGARTISDFCKGRTVCNHCNNGTLSELDRELCSRSYLSVVAAHELGAFVWQTWDVDHGANNLLLEATPDFAASSMTLLPQIIFEQDGPQLRGDLEELQRFGQEGFASVLVRSARRAFGNFKAGKKRWLHFERIDPNSNLLARYRYPPRIFVGSSIRDLAKKLLAGKRASLVVRYLSESDKRFALSQLDNWNSSRRIRRFGVGLGSKMPSLRCSYELGAVMRALTKMGVNLLAAFCPNTPVDRDGFTGVMQIVLGEIPLQPALMGINGFVHASDIEPINAANAAHSFRLLHMGGKWRIYSSFFGGRVGSRVRFPGPNGESWNCADVVAPLKSKNWTIKTSRLLQPLQVRVEWQDPPKIIPSVEMLNVQSQMRVVSVSADKAKTNGPATK